MNINQASTQKLSEHRVHGGTGACEALMQGSSSDASERLNSGGRVAVRRQFASRGRGFATSGAVEPPIHSEKPRDAHCMSERAAALASNNPRCSRPARSALADSGGAPM